MNRRGFIAALAAFASTAVLDPERALWVPGAKTISVPAKIQDYLLEHDGQEFFPVYGPDGGISHEAIYYTERFVDGKSVGKFGKRLNDPAMFAFLHTPREEWTERYPQLHADMMLPRRSMVADNPAWAFGYIR